MSITLPLVGVLQPPKSLLLPDTSTHDLLSLAANSTGTTNVIGLVIVNTDSSAQKVTVWWHDGATDFAIFERVVPATDTVTEALAVPIQLNARQATKKITAKAAVGAKVTVTVISTLSSQETRQQ